MAHEPVLCPTCGPVRAARIRHSHDAFMLTPGEFTVATCPRCSLVFVHPRPERGVLDSYYPPHYWGSPEEAPGPDAATDRVIATLLSRCPGGTVLDVGCGIGKKTVALQAAGFTVVGLEPYEQACRVAREHYGLDVECGYLQETSLPPDTFDAVTMFDVLEHLHDPLGDLGAIRSSLKPGGVCCAKVPNLTSLQSRVLGVRWFQLDIPRHLQNFSPRSLRGMFERAGFTDVCCLSIPDTLGAFYFEMSILMWLRNWRVRRDTSFSQPKDGETLSGALEGKVYSGVPRLGKRVFRWLIRNVLYAPLWLENWVGRSVTLLAVARKPD